MTPKRNIHERKEAGRIKISDFPQVQFTVPVTVEPASMQRPPSPGNSIFVTLLRPPRAHFALRFRMLRGTRPGLE